MGRHSDGARTTSTSSLAALVAAVRRSGTAELAGWGLFAAPLAAVALLLTGHGWLVSLGGGALVLVAFAVLLVAGMAAPRPPRGSGPSSQ